MITEAEQRALRPKVLAAMEGLVEHLTEYERRFVEKDARIAELETALEWAEQALDNAHAAGLLGGDEGSPEQIEFEQNMAPIRAVLPKKEEVR